MYTPTVIEMMILEFLSGTNNDRICYNGIKSSAFLVSFMSLSLLEICQRVQYVEH